MSENEVFKLRLGWDGINCRYWSWSYPVSGSVDWFNANKGFNISHFLICSVMMLRLWAMIQIGVELHNWKDVEGGGLVKRPDFFRFFSMCPLTVLFSFWNENIAIFQDKPAQWVYELFYKLNMFDCQMTPRNDVSETCSSLGSTIRFDYSFLRWIRPKIDSIQYSIQN